MRRVDRARLALVAASLLFFIAIWIVVPAPIYSLLAFSVGAPELAPWLILLATLVSLISAIDARRRVAALMALAIAIAAIALPAWVLARIPQTIARLDRTMAEALGPTYAPRPRGDARDGARLSPIVVTDFFRGLPATNVRVERHIIFATNDGVPLALDVYRPADTVVHPAVMQVYAGGWESGAPEDEATFSGALASAGYVIFAIDYRHAPQWHWPAQLADASAALSWIEHHAAEHGADPNQLVLFGRSAGAELSFITAQTFPTPAIRAVVLYYSPVDLEAGYATPGYPDTLNTRALERAFIGGTPDERRDAYRAASPLTYADRPHPPVLLVHGGRDDIVYPQYAGVFYDHLRRSGLSALLVIPWANHAFDVIPFGPSSQLALFYTEQFLSWALAR